MGLQGIDFDAVLDRGLRSYEEVLGRWWLRQSANPAHQRAYRNIARYIHASFQKQLRLVIDYGCGPGELLTRLAWRYPRTRFVGLDGSRFLLREAQRRLARHGKSYSNRVRLVHMPLPGFDKPHRLADLVVFAFPNILPAGAGGNFGFAEAHLTRSERHILRCLSEHTGREQRSSGPATEYATLLRDRALSLHIRRLLKPGGACVRVEYGDIRREEMSRAQLLRTMMEEGTLESAVDGRMPRIWFRVLACRYFRSGVIEDVRHQDGSSGRGGGYMVSVLRAV